jgi:hypothetical protein
VHINNRKKNSLKSKTRKRVDEFDLSYQKYRGNTTFVDFCADEATVSLREIVSRQSSKKGAIQGGSMPKWFQAHDNQIDSQSSDDGGVFMDGHGNG